MSEHSSLIRNHEKGNGGRWIEYMPVDALPDAEANPKLHDVHGIARSIETFGLAEATVLDERTGKVLHGHGRRDALRILRDTTGEAPEGVTVEPDGSWLAPVLRGWSSRDDDHAQATALALNQHTITGGWNDAELGRVLERLATQDPELPTVAGFNIGDVAAIQALTDSPAHPLPDFDSSTPTPNLTDQDILAATDRESWPLIRARVSPDVHRRWSHVAGDDDAERVKVVLDIAGY